MPLLHNIFWVLDIYLKKIFMIILKTNLVVVIKHDHILIHLLNSREILHSYDIIIYFLWKDSPSILALTYHNYYKFLCFN